jgi:hypothetical protein
MTTELILALLPSIGTALTVWIHLNMEVAKLRVRVSTLEGDSRELKRLLKEVHDMVMDIKIQIAKSGHA